MTALTRALLPTALLLLAPSAPEAAAAPTPQLTTGDESLVLLITGANNHHWEFTSRILAEALEASGKFRVVTTESPDEYLANEDLGRFDAFVLDYNGPRWGEPAETRFVDAVRGGTGVVVVHAANNAFPGWTEYEQIVGHLWREGTGHGRLHPFDVELIDRDHPITQGMRDIEAHLDELYHDLVNVQGTSHRVLAVAHSSKESGGTGEREPMIMVGQFGAGRVFHTALGHVWRGNKLSRETVRDARFQDLVQRGTEWAATGAVTSQVSAPNTLSEKEQADGWKLLFDGRTTAGWRGFKQEGFPAQGWEVRDGCLIVSGGGGDLITTETYGDFELSLEFKVTPKANSGIMYRVTEEEDATWYTGPEFQILDDALLGEFPDLKHSVGALYDMIPPPPKVVRLPGSWNHARIVVKDWNVQHWLNGFLVAETDLGGPAGARLIAASKFAKMKDFARAPSGHIALQDHGDEVWFRSIKLKAELPGTPLFNGEDLTGWTAHLAAGNPDADPSEVWRVSEDGYLICKGSPAGYLRTEADYTNFVLRLQWRWDPSQREGGNSGVLVRLVGEDKVWPKSLEAQLQAGSAGDLWVIDGFGVDVPAERTSGRHTRATHHNEKPVGLWNDCTIVVKGGEVSLWVNGELVNQATNADVVPGKIALQSEGAEIHFRQILITDLD